MIAVLWTVDFFILNHAATWLPITATAVVLSTYYLWRDPALRQLLRPSPRVFVLGLAAAAVMVAVTYAGFQLLAPRWAAFARATAGLYQLLDSGHYGWLSLSLLLLPTTFGEEVIFRGRLLQATDRSPPRRGRGAVRTPLLAAALYALMHLGSGSFTLVAIAFVCGLYWSGLRLYSGSLWPSILAHSVWDLAILVVHPLR